MTPTVWSNTKYRCNNCKGISDFEGRLPTPCLTCGAFDWDQIVVQHVCDVCASTNASWEYPCKDFPAPSIPGLPMRQMSRGSWAACDECHALIEANDRNGLSTRALESKDFPGELRPVIVQMIRGLHDGFFANRIGDAIHHE